MNLDDPQVPMRDYLEARLVPLDVAAQHLDKRIDDLTKRLALTEAAVATLQGRMIAFAAAGALFGGTVAEAISHLLAS